MSITWPAPPFPQYPISDNYGEQLGDPTIRMDTDVGPIMSYRRASKALAHFVAVYELHTVALTNQARDLWRKPAGGTPYYGCNYGNETILWPTPRADGVTLTAWMIGPPQLVHIGGLVWQITYPMAVLE